MDSDTSTSFLDEYNIRYRPDAVKAVMNSLKNLSAADLYNKFRQLDEWESNLDAREGTYGAVQGLRAKATIKFRSLALSPCKTLLSCPERAIYPLRWLISHLNPHYLQKNGCEGYTSSARLWSLLPCLKTPPSTRVTAMTLTATTPDTITASRFSWKSSLRRRRVLTRKRHTRPFPCPMSLSLPQQALRRIG